MRRLREDSELPPIHPELIDFDALEAYLLDNMTHRGPDPDWPTVTVLDYPNPRAYYGDDGRLFLRRVAESLHEANGRRRLTARDIEALMREPRLGVIAERLYRLMNGAEKRKFRHRLTVYTLSNNEVEGLADLLPDAAPTVQSSSPAVPSRRRERRRAVATEQWCSE